jgi:hypothetical protein
LDLFGRRGHFNCDGTRTLRDEPLHTYSRRYDAAIPRVKPPGDASGSLQVSHHSFQDDLIFSDLAVPVMSPIISRGVKADNHLHSLIPEERIRIGLLEITNEIEVPHPFERGILFGPNASDPACHRSFHYSLDPPISW